MPEFFDPKTKLRELLSAGVHFGHLTRRWNPKMRPFIFMEKNGIHVIDLKKTVECLETACTKMAQIVASGEKILFIGTKRQAQSIVMNEAERSGMFYVVNRWLGGMLTNFSTIRKSIKHMQNLDKMEMDGTFEKITKKERLIITREKAKLRKVFNGIEEMKQLPGGVFVIDTKKETIAVKEANRIGIPVFAMVDTNCDPDRIDYPIPGNDDAFLAVKAITKTVADAIVEATQNRAAYLQETAPDDLETAMTQGVHHENYSVEDEKPEKTAEVEAPVEAENTAAEPAETTSEPLKEEVPVAVEEVAVETTEAAAGSSKKKAAAKKAVSKTEN